MELNVPIAKIDTLLEEAEQLEEDAQALQATYPSTSSIQQVRGFRNRYQSWYADALSVLPEDLKEQFIDEFKNRRFSVRIEGFISAPTQPNILFGEASQENSGAAPWLQWQHPVGTTFAQRFHNQQALLRQARARREEPSSADKAVVFLAHGHSTLYMQIYQHLKDELHLDPVAFETEDHTSQQITEVLHRYLNRATVAIVIMTGEETTSDNRRLARQNVVHEAGLFQAKLGFDRVAILKEKGVEDFSNIQGLIYIPFDPHDVTTCFYKLDRFLRRWQPEPNVHNS